ncbi:MAG TPA: aminotransferase [Bacteroidetes bacterium]|jgi:selenocysteine lyase/cysteine desulfurase|nr:MAG: aminotransferase V [Sphingobacteriales bacterium BACL12 MAG-120813-bin55]HCK22638.1 aminotransferase [Bacteroidota bacterium]
MNSRRKFIRNLVGSGVAGWTLFADQSVLAAIDEQLQAHATLPVSVTAEDETFWATVQQAYTASTNIINLNNGGVSPAPKVVQDAVERYNQLSNEAPSYYMWRVLDKGREGLRKKLAGLAGCDAEEIAINRNTTEALDNVIFGLDFAPGDEIVLTKQDYPNMINAWKQRALRDGIVLKWVNLDLPVEDDDYLVAQYSAQFTEKTRLVQVNHVINWTGHINPVKKIADAAHARGIEVLIDGAHSFGHFEFDIPALGGDYFGTSLHKWLSAPIGSGMLWVKKEKIAKVWPLFPGESPQSDDIRKFENMGTRSFPIEQAIGQAIDFHNMIGPARKEARLRYLKNYWVNQVKDLPGVRMNTTTHPAYSCGIANIGIEGKEPGALDSFLFQHYNIHCVAINWENIHGVRIAPHVYTSLQNLDQLVAGIQSFTS